MVVLFHAYPSVFSGGFIGVDVFFVISGYVISRRYLANLVGGKESIQAFFLARFRRLAAALSLVLLSTAAVSIIILPPDRLMAFGWSLAAQTIYAQNFVFWSEGDYFSAALSKPLLHTWSLAVEEQFYITWALAIWLFRRKPKLLFVVFVISCLASFAVGIGIETRSPKTAFYMLPMRIWELGLGIAAFLLTRYKDWQWTGSLYFPSLLLAGGIIASGFFPENSAFPGTQSLVACISTAALLYFLEKNSGSPSLHWLRFPPMLYTGAISYGFYLWHWPPLSLFFFAMGRPANAMEATVLMVLAFGAASLSYHFVEEPIRRKRWLVSGKAMLSGVAVSSLMMIIIAATIQTTSGMVQRYPEHIQSYLMAPNERGKTRCGKLFVFLNPSATMCPVWEDGETGNGILVLGDSHSDVLKEMLGDAAKVAGRNLYLTVRNCELGRFGTYGFCSNAVLQSILDDAKRNGISEVVAISHWDEDILDAALLQADLEKITNAGMHVSLMRTVPNSKDYDPKKRAQRALEGEELSTAGISLESYKQNSRELNDKLDRAVESFPVGRVEIFSAEDVICPDGKCVYVIDGKPLYLDSNHLTFTGANLLKDMFVERFRRPR